MKKYLRISVFAVLVLALVIVFAIAGCSTGATSAKATAKTMKASDITIGFSVWTMEFTFFQNVEKGVKDACADLGFKYTMLDQKSDATQMVQDMNTLVNQKVSGIVSTPVDPGAMGPAVQKARDAGIPVVCADIGKSGPVNALIISDNFKGGGLAAEYLAQLLPDSATNFFGLGNNNPQWTYARQRGEGFKAKSDELKYTIKSEIIVQNASAEGGYDTMQQIMSAAPDITGAFFTSGREAVGAANYVKSQDKDIKVIGYNGDPEEFVAMRDGILAGTILQQPYLIGYKAVETLKEILVDGKSYENVEIPAEVKLVTPENLDQVAQEVMDSTGNSAFGE